VKETTGHGVAEKPRGKRRQWLFPFGMMAIYLAIYLIAPDRAVHALMESGRVLKQMVLPLLLAFAMMVALNWYVSPAQVTRYLGSPAGVQGVFFSSVAGIVSMGPVMAWLPFLAAIREKGASDFHLVNFLTSRAVKPVLLPLMIGYFGWCFSLVFTVLNMAGALLVAAVVAGIGRGRERKTEAQ
jgi:uncharacterized membrane protein YraQ (UPF0718 family)